jgi:hypothetical protein
MDTSQTPTRRAGIQPWCPFHLDAMIEPAGKTADYYSCRRPYCGLHWGAATDYFRFVNQKPFRTPEQEPDETLCPQPGHGHMFISGTRNYLALWECSVEGCSETQEKQIPAPNVWAIPRDQRQSYNPAEIPAQPAMPNRPAVKSVRGARKRPRGVWMISILYTLSFLLLVRFVFLVASGALPVSTQLRQYLANLGTIGVFLAIFQPLLALTAAIALFLLRKEATFFFWILLGIAFISNGWSFAVRSGLPGTQGGPGLGVGVIISMVLQLCTCLYVQQLRMEGTLR